MKTVINAQSAGPRSLLPARDFSAVPLDELIAQSHVRSEIYGIQRTDVPDFSALGDIPFSRAFEENKFLVEQALPVMESLYEQIANTHNMVLLSSPAGLVLHSLGDLDFVEKAMQVALMPGVNWSEQSKGTNAIGTALQEKQAVSIFGTQHYSHANDFLACSCAPIVDPYGQVIGALDVTGDQRNFHQHTMALVRMSVQMIENHMFADIFPDAIRICFHARPEFVGTLVEGIAVFSNEGRFLSANRSAQFQLGLSFNALQAHTFSSLFGIPVSRLHELFCSALVKPRQLCLNSGLSVWCSVKMKPLGHWLGGRVMTSDTQSQQVFTESSTPARANSPKPHLSTLRYLDTGDPQVAAVIQKLTMVRGRDIPIMILGETGSGKDLLAQAIHGDSDRAAQPFVSVNCASIPETLIESELFGYEEGAFTGGRKKGALGKIVQANGGTLFLDEIGDMPRHLQARLLRVLQDRKVSPLGAGKEIKVDVMVICATNKNLKSMIAKGEFREDLYYRLNGLVVRLPALRDRTDFDFVVKKILASFCDKGDAIRIAPDVMSMFQSYNWPGNFRQLYNLLRTAAVMIGCNGLIERCHLPDDFLEEQAQPATVQNDAILTTRTTPVAADTSVANEPVIGSQPDPASQFSNTGTVFQCSESPDNQPVAAGEGQRLQDVALVTMAQMLRIHKGNVSAAAKALGVSRNTVYRRKDQLPADVWN